MADRICHGIPSRRQAMILLGVATIGVSPTMLTGCVGGAAAAAPEVLLGAETLTGAGIDLGAGAGPAIAGFGRRLAEALLYEVLAEAVLWAAKQGIGSLRDATGEPADDGDDQHPVEKVRGSGQDGNGPVIWAVRPRGARDESIDRNDRVVFYTPGKEISVIRPRAADAIHRSALAWTQGWPDSSAKGTDGKAVSTIGKAPGTPTDTQRVFIPTGRIRTVDPRKWKITEKATLFNAFTYPTAAGTVRVAAVDHWPDQRRLPDGSPFGSHRLEVSVFARDAQRTFAFAIQEEGALSLGSGLVY